MSFNLSGLVWTHDLWGVRSLRLADLGDLIELRLVDLLVAARENKRVQLSGVPSLGL